MGVEEIWEGSIGEDNSSKDRFPVGMRVLAVDDDPTCLRLLETLLRRCKYHVTTNSQAIQALKMLRENKNRFDLVISDVHMPDMDGFKLLEHVGLEMDLPVIMMSVNGDSELVMKGITHGACDYLLKPVRIEELKNIWQHVIRRKKFDSKDFNNTDNQGEHQPETAEGGEKLTGTGNADGNGKLNRKRKDQNEDKDDESEENGNESEDPATQKKPRVVWSVELHRKFVAAVNQLGIDKAVPKRILDMMNVEKLTRENVASHLQKYRLYLKRISCVAGQQKNMVAALGIKDTSYLCMNSLEGLGDLHALAGSRQIPNISLSSCQQGVMLSRLNASAGLGLHGSSSPGMIQQGHGLKSSDYVNDFGKRQQVIAPVNHNVSLLQGMPTYLELEQFQHNKCISRIGEFSSPSNDLTVFPVASGFPESGVTIGGSSYSFLNTTNSPLLLQGHPHQAKSRGGLGNQSSGGMASLNTDSLDADASMSSQFPDHDRFNSNWQSAVTLPGFPLNPLCMGSTFNDDISPSSNLRENVYSRTPDNGISTLDCSSISSVTSVSTFFLNSRRDLRCQAGPINNGLHHENSKFSNTMCNNVGQIYAPKQRWDGNQDYHHNRNLIFGSSNLSTSTHGVMGSLGHILDQGNETCSKKMDASLISQLNCGASVLVQHNEVEKSAIYTTMKQKEAHMDKTKLQGSYISNGNGSLEDIMSEIIKREQDEMTSVNGDFGIGIHSPGTCM